MSDARQAILGVLAALICAFIVLGSLAMALAENRQRVAQVQTSTPTSPPVNTPLPGQPTFTPSPTPLPTWTPTAADTSTCPQPPGWQRYDILPGDTLADLAQAFGTTEDTLRRNNCDVVDAALSPGVYIFVPLLQATETPTPTMTLTASVTSKPRKPTRTPEVCSGPPNGWVIYIIRTGDTLSSIGRATGTTAAQLMAANCLATDLIHTGDLLYVPRLPAVNTPVPTRRPVNTSVPTRTPIPTSPPRPSPTENPPPTIAPTEHRIPTEPPVTPPPYPS